MRDVARAAGVSQQTVSRVLRDHPNVRTETRDRVMAAVRALDYRPNSAARALVTGRTRTLVVVSPDTALYSPAATVFGIESAARQAGYFVSIISLKSLTRSAFAGEAERLRDRAVDGIIVIGPELSAMNALAHLPPGVPVLVLEGAHGAGVPVVGADQHASAARATQRLLGLGHPTVWPLAGPLDWRPALERMAGWRATLEAAGIDPPPVLHGDWSPRSGYELGQQLAREAELSAVFVASDQMAFGMLRAFHEAGRAAPRDVSVVAFDDVPESRYFTPPLTTVRQDFIEVGRRTFGLLAGRMDGGDRHARALVVPELIVRESTGPR